MKKVIVIVLVISMAMGVVAALNYSQKWRSRPASAHTNWTEIISQIEREEEVTLPLPTYIPELYLLQQVTTYSGSPDYPSLQLIYSKKDISQKVEQLKQEALERAQREQGREYDFVKYFARSVRELTLSEPSILILEIETTWSESGKQWWPEGYWHEFVKNKENQLKEDTGELAEVGLFDLDGIKGFYVLAKNECSISFAHSGFNLRLVFNEEAFEEAMNVAKSIPQRAIPADRLLERPKVQETTHEEAEQVMISTLHGGKNIWSFIPIPSYLPSEYDLQMVVMEGKDKVFMFYSDEKMSEQVKYFDDLQRLLRQDGGAKFWIMGMEAEGMEPTTQFSQRKVESSGGIVVDMGEVKGLLQKHDFQGQTRYEIEWQLNDFFFYLLTDYGVLTESEVIKIAGSAVPESIYPR